MTAIYKLACQCWQPLHPSPDHEVKALVILSDMDPLVCLSQHRLVGHKSASHTHSVCTLLVHDYHALVLPSLFVCQILLIQAVGVNSSSTIKSYLTSHLLEWCNANEGQKKNNQACSTSIKNASRNEPFSVVPASYEVKVSDNCNNNAICLKSAPFACCHCSRSCKSIWNQKKCQTCICSKLCCLQRLTPAVKQVALMHSHLIPKTNTRTPNRVVKRAALPNECCL